MTSPSSAHADLPESAPAHQYMRPSDGNALISVIIPTYNEERNLGRLLASIKAQQGVSCETILVDQASTDRTIAIARAYGCEVIVTPRPSYYSPPGRNRNIGAALAKGAILLHLDADMELPPGLLGNLAGLLTNSQQAAVIHERDLAVGFWSKCKALERRCYWDSELEAARAVGKTLFKSVGGYHDGVSSGEDFYISKRYELQTRLVRDPSLVLLHHIGHSSLRGLLRKKFLYGRTAWKYLEITRGSEDQAWRRMLVAYLGAYIRNWRILLRDPVHFLGLLPLRVMEFAALSTGIVIGNRRQPLAASEGS